jgi:hypothetical protein
MSMSTIALATTCAISPFAALHSHRIRLGIPRPHRGIGMGRSRMFTFGERHATDSRLQTNQVFLRVRRGRGVDLNPTGVTPAVPLAHSMRFEEHIGHLTLDIVPPARPKRSPQCQARRSSYGRFSTMR